MSQGFTYDASFGGIRIDVESSDIDHGRKLASHKYPKRDGATNKDQGREPWVCSLEFVFGNRRIQEGETEQPGSAIERWEIFDKLVAEGPVRRLVHPYTKSRLCKISGYRHHADGEGEPTIRCSATFTEEHSHAPTFAVGVGVQTIAGSHEVQAKALQALASLDLPNVALDPIELSAAQAEIAQVAATVDNWDADPTLTARGVHLQMATLNNALGARLEALDCASDIDRYPIMKQYTLLQYQVRLAAEAFTTETTRIVTITTITPLPLRVIATRFYGADQSERRFAEMLELNPELRSPALVDGGIELRAYARGSEPGVG